MDLQAGSTVGDYQVVGILGVGGMGKVYQVRNAISDRIEAMKVLLPDLATEPALADRFLREIKVQASLVHPNIAALHSAVRVDNQLLMLIEFVEGVTLEQKLKDGPLPAVSAVSYVTQVLAALEYAHGRGVIHRDIKPANMMLTPEGVVKLMDFGIAKAGTDRKLTMTGTTLGSLYYMSPEQIQGAATLDGRSDLYSVGVSLYELVTGKRPFDGDSQFAIMSAHLEKTPVPPITVVPKLPQMLNDIILMAVAKDPAARFQSAGAFRNALSNVAAGGGVVFDDPRAAATAATPAAASATTAGASATPAAAGGDFHLIEPTRPKPPKGRRGLWMGLGAVAAAAALIAVIEFGPWKGAGAAPQRETAPPPQTVAAPVSAPVSAPAQATAPPATQMATPATPVAAPATQPLTAPVRQAATPARPTVSAPSQRTQTGIPMPPAALQPAPQVPVQQQAQPAPAPVPAATHAELQQAREQLAMLGVRAGGIRASLETLQRSQAASGLNLRGDMQQAAGLTTTYLEGANAALNDGNATQAKIFMDKAERQIEKLEKFLNR